MDKRLNQMATDAEKRLEATKEQYGQKVEKAADVFDKKVHEGVRETKGWFSSWFGPSK